MEKVLYERDGRIGRITLNRPEKLNAIDNDLPEELSTAVSEAERDSRIHVMILSGNGKAFCSGYDLEFYASSDSPTNVVQKLPWNPEKDFDFMWRNTEHFMSLWHAEKPVICKIHGAAVAGGSDIALCSDLIIMGENALIGYMPARVWGCPTTAMWVYRLGVEKAKRMLLTGDKITGREAEAMGLILKAVPENILDDEVEKTARRISTVPVSQLSMQKKVINHAIERSGLIDTQRLATMLDGQARHSTEGLNFKKRVELIGWKKAVKERDTGTYDWTNDQPFPPQG
ncbi:MAG: putative enoyl-CoA hydratase echA8 [Alphaproteobacteria bacterium MarineAlpha3_Bin5]|nr:MAG: putative enoyl-CoA hydratase echA8 [Alphaproteobacteria bacterium MarineAlpha3_Bin5]